MKKNVDSLRKLVTKMSVWSIFRKVGSILLFILYLGYLSFKAPIFTEFGVINLIEYILVLLIGGHINYSLLRKEISPLFMKN